MLFTCQWSLIASGCKINDRLHGCHLWSLYHTYPIISLVFYFRAVATGQVLRYLPDHLFSKLPERFPVSIIQKWAKPIVIEFDISCAWILWSNYDKTHHLDCRYLTFTPQNASEMLSDGLKILGEHAPRPPPPSTRALCAHNANATPTFAIILIPDHSKFRGYGSVFSSWLWRPSVKIIRYQCL